MRKIFKIILPVLFLLHSYDAYAVIAVTQITHASFETDVTGFTYNCDGAIDITASGNAGPFTFQWNDGVVSEDRSDLCSGWYTVTITNAFGCSKILDAYIKSCQYDPVQITGHKITPIDLTTFKGGINIELNMQSQGLIFVWRNAAHEIVGTNQNLSNVPYGEYCVTISGACGVPPLIRCFTIEKCSYASPFEKDLLTFQTIAPCPKSSNGSINMTVNFGLPPYSFLWSNNAVTEDISSLSPKTYHVKVTDSLGCFLSEMVELKPDIQDLRLIKLVNACSLKGEIGIEPVPQNVYSYTWSNGVSQTGINATITNLQPANYCVTATNNNTSCSLTRCWAISSGITADKINILELQNDNCTEGCNGKIELIIDENQAVSASSSSNTSFVFQWNGPNNFSTVSTSPVLNGICKGLYTVTVTNSDGCSGVREIEMCCCGGAEFDESCLTLNNEPAYTFNELQLVSPNIVYPSVTNGLPGSITVNTNGLGVSPIYYTWAKNEDPSFVAHSNTISNLTPGTYCVTVTDGCMNYQRELHACYTLTGVPFSSNYRHTCPGGHNGRISVFIPTGLSHIADFPPPYKIFLNNILSTTTTSSTNLQNLSAGTYTLAIVDANNKLVYEKQYTIEENDDAMYYDQPLQDMQSSLLFNSDNNCMESILGGLFWSFNAGGQPKIFFDWNYNYDYLCPSCPSVTIVWPDGGFSAVDFDAEGKHSVSGADNYEVNSPGAYQVRVVGNSGCYIEECFSFGEEQTIPVAPGYEMVTLPNTSFVIPAYTGCKGQKKCGSGCPQDTQEAYSSSQSGHEQFEYIPNDNVFPCSGGRLILKCSDPQTEIIIEETGLEYVDFSQPPTQSNLEGYCKFNVGCLFPVINHPFFDGNYPVYVEPEGGILLPVGDANECTDPNSGSGSGPVSVDCEGEASIVITNSDECRGILMCINSDGSISSQFNTDFSSIQLCKEIIHGVPTCTRRIFCEITGKVIANITVECEEGIDYLDCSYARPSDSRSFNGVILSGNNGALSVYPNPFKNLINLVFQSESAGAGKISLFDITGQLIKNQPLQVSSGENTIAMNLADSISKAGFFLLKLETPDGSTHIVKIIRKPD